jgi:hypothetical protein
MRNRFVATAAALAMMVAVPLFARDTDPSFAEDRDFLFEEDRDATFKADRDSAFDSEENWDSRFAGDTSAPGIDRRQRNQQRRIQYGVRIGSITPREAAMLGRLLARIEHQERRFKVDGHFTRAERARIHQLLDHSGRRIHLAMHNGRIER